MAPLASSSTRLQDYSASVKRESGFVFGSSPLNTNDQAETINDARQSVSSTYHIFKNPDPKLKSSPVG